MDSSEHTFWVYGAIAILFIWNAWLSVVVIGLIQKIAIVQTIANGIEKIHEDMREMNKRLDLFLHQEIDSLKKISEKR